MISDVNKVVNDLVSIVFLLGGSLFCKDYEEVCKFVEYFLEYDLGSLLVDMLIVCIDVWEDNVVEFEEFNMCFEVGKNGVLLLWVFMQ